MRTEMARPSGVMNVTVFDGGKQVLYMVDPTRKTYFEMTKADVDRLGAQVHGAVAQMQSQLEKLPPAQRAQMEAMMQGVERTRTGSDGVGRWTCDKYDLTMNGQKIGEVCNVSRSTLGFGASDFDVMRQMGPFYSGMAPQVAGQLALSSQSCSTLSRASANEARRRSRSASDVLRDGEHSARGTAGVRAGHAGGDARGGPHAVRSVANEVSPLRQVPSSLTRRRLEQLHQPDHRREQR
jgi:hypothetical protein